MNTSVNEVYRRRKWANRIGLTLSMMAMALGDAYRLKLIEVYFSPTPADAKGRDRKKEDVQRLAEASALWYRKAAERSPRDDVPGVRLEIGRAHV